MIQRVSSVENPLDLVCGEMAKSSENRLDFSHEHHISILRITSGCFYPPDAQPHGGSLRANGNCKRPRQRAPSVRNAAGGFRPTAQPRGSAPPRRGSGDVNPTVTVRANAARTAAGSHQSLTGRLISTARHTVFLRLVPAAACQLADSTENAPNCLASHRFAIPASPSRQTAHEKVNVIDWPFAGERR